MTSNVRVVRSALYAPDTFTIIQDTAGRPFLLLNGYLPRKKSLPLLLEAIASTAKLGSNRLKSLNESIAAAYDRQPTNLKAMRVKQ